MIGVEERLLGQLQGGMGVDQQRAGAGELLLEAPAGAR